MEIEKEIYLRIAPGTDPEKAYFAPLQYSRIKMAYCVNNNVSGAEVVISLTAQSKEIGRFIIPGDAEAGTVTKLRRNQIGTNQWTSFGVDSPLTITCDGKQLNPVGFDLTIGTTLRY